ncbi:MAG: hypothetical protein KDE51_02025 [Anaerolineales bacterium]|nr:hypothetical protein [Anaerolineales bacterium]
MLKIVSYSLLIVFGLIGIGVRFQELKFYKSHKFIMPIILSVLLAIDPIYYAVSNLSGISNFAWLLSYLLLIVSVYYMAKTCWEIFEASMPNYIFWFSCLSAISLTFIFIFGIATTPNWPDHDIPRSSKDMMFMVWLYMHVSLIIILLIRQVYLARRTAVQEVNLPARHIIDFYLVAATIICSGFVLKAFVTISSYEMWFQPRSQLLLVELSRLLMTFGGIIWMVGFFSPNYVMVDLSQVTSYLTKWRQLHTLRKLERELHKFVPPATSNPVLLVRKSWVDEVKDPDFYLHHVLVSILDASKNLSAKKQTCEQEDRLITLLSQLPQDGDFKELIFECQLIVRHL